VPEVLPTPERAAAIQQQLAELLQTHGGQRTEEPKDQRTEESKI